MRVGPDGKCWLCRGKGKTPGHQTDGGYRPLMTCPECSGGEGPNTVATDAADRRFWCRVCRPDADPFVALLGYCYEHAPESCNV